MKLELRIAWLATIFALLFGSLLTRLWFVQIAEGPEFAEDAQSLQLRDEILRPSRGFIVDRNGAILAGTRPEPAVVIDRRFIPHEIEDAVIQELAGLVEVEPQMIRDQFAAAGSGNRFELAGEVTPEQVYFVRTNQDRFSSGVSIELVSRRTYPEGSLMAHILGYIGSVSPEDLEEDPSLDPTGKVGRVGIEAEYESQLRGIPGHEYFTVNESGGIEQRQVEIAPETGNTVVLTLDAGVQRVAEQALADGIAMSKRDLADSEAEHGAVVVLDVTTGEVVAMASYPTYDPSAFVTGITTNEFTALQDAQAFNNLAIQGLYPPGSTFKGITYAFAVEEGFWPQRAHTDGPEGSLECTGVLTANSLEEASQKRFTDPGHGIVDLHVALGASCNIYFWEVALAAWNQTKNTPDEDLLQEWAERLGLGSPTGIDLPFEAAGQVPDRQLFEQWAEDAPFRLDPSRINPGPIWVGGDLMNVAIGQGEVTATPLQMAVAYAALANGGTVWEPRIVDRILDAEGMTIGDVEPAVAERIELSEQFTEIFNNDMALTVNAEYGTAHDAFRSMEQAWQVGGKTGTATKAGAFDTAWFVGVAPVSSPRYAVAVVVEEGGGGGRIAAPIARQIFQHLLGENVDPVEAGL